LDAMTRPNSQTDVRMKVRIEQMFADVADIHKPLWINVTR